MFKKIIKRLFDILWLLFFVSLIIAAFYIYGTFKEQQFSTKEFIFICGFVILCLLFSISEILPKADNKAHKLSIILFIVKIILSILLTTSIYQIYYLTSENLDLAYYIIIVSATLLVLIGGMESIRNRYVESQVKEDYILLFVGKTILICLPLLFYLYSIFTIFYKPDTITSFDYLQSPAFIEIKKEPEATETILDNKIDHTVASISDSSEIKTIMTDIRNAHLKSLSGVKYLDYERKKSITKPIYHISFDNFNTEKNYNLAYIELNNRNEATAFYIIYSYQAFYNPFVNSMKLRYYPITFSPESLNILDSYITTYLRSASKGESQ